MLGGFGALITGAALGLWRKSFGRSGTLDAGPAAGPEASLSGTRATMPGEATPTTTSTVMAATQPAPTTPGGSASDDLTADHYAARADHYAARTATSDERSTNHYFSHHHQSASHDNVHAREHY